MTASERMSKVEAALAERGVRDVKFFFNLTALAKPGSEVGENVCHVLEQYLAGQFTSMGKLGDAIAA